MLVHHRQPFKYYNRGYVFYVAVPSYVQYYFIEHVGRSKHYPSKLLITPVYHLRKFFLAWNRYAKKL